MFLPSPDSNDTSQMAVSFSKNVTEPGDESVFLSVETTAHSYVGLLAVDQSVLLLPTGNDISQKVVSSLSIKIMNELKYIT